MAFYRDICLVATLCVSAGFFNTALANPHVLLKTNKGNIEVELFEQKAPISSQNFLKYAKSGFYDGTIFHRVIPNFMVQAGGFDTHMREKNTDAPIKNEAKNGLKNTRGTLAMARTNVVDSATSQFFINTVDNAALDHGVRDYGYAVFGRVVKGMDIVDQISTVATTRAGMHFDVPVQAVVIQSVQVLQPNKAKPITPVKDKADKEKAKIDAAL